MGVAGGLFSVWCGLMKLYHRVKSLMKSLILSKIGTYILEAETNKILKKIKD
jgi:hypothetical protein